MSDSAAAATSPKRLLLAGDARGELGKLYAQVTNQQKRVGAFDAVLAVGAFLPGIGDVEAAAGFAKYATGKEKAPITTYFIESRSAALLQAAPEGKTLCDGVHFLGGVGVKELCGLRVAYLSGKYDAEVFAAQSAGGSTPLFVGAAYTQEAIRKLVSMCQVDGAPLVDVLLTAEWPARIEEKLLESDRPKHPEGTPVNWTEITAPPIADLCASIEPRYHIFGTADIFYQRPPFQTPTRGHVCRCIGLGAVGSKGKGRLWIHGLALSPAKVMPDVALKQRPDSTTPCPFLQTVSESNTVNRGTKRSFAETEANGRAEEEEGAIVPNQVFLARLPPNIDEKRLEKAFKHVGKIQRISLARDKGAPGQPCKGFGWVTFSTAEEAEAACELNEMLECGNRKISISLSRERKHEVGGKRRTAQILIEPHAECWFCLVNPQVEKHMIVTATTEVYVAMARGGINQLHVLVLPVKHAPCFAACPSDLQQALQAHIVAIRKMCLASGRDVIVWERWIPLGTSAMNHMQLQVLPIDQSKAPDALEALEAMVKRHMSGASFRRVGSHQEVAEHLNDDSSAPYIYFELPGENTAKGRQIERFVYSSSNPRIPMNFGRHVACELLGCGDKVDWRQCQEDRDVEKRLAVAFREKFKPYQPKQA